MTTERSEFEEKEYEGALYPELRGSSGIRPWTPGQVLEGQLGFDAALFVANSFWSVVNRAACEGVRLARYGLSPMVRELHGSEEKPSDDLPDFSLNLFVQAKRPSVYQDPPEKVRDGGIEAPSFYFDVTPHQQAILERLAAHLGANADVTYACAAFMTKKELFSLPSLVPNSTFPPVTTLKGHDRWYYNHGGTRGVAHSEPEAIDELPLLERIARMARQHPPALPAWSPEYEEEWAKEEIGAEIGRRGEALVPRLERIWEALSGALAEVPAEQAEPAQEILAHVRAIDPKLPEYVRLVVQISTVTAHLDVAWLVVAPGRSTP